MAQAKTAWVDFKEIKGRVSIIQILQRYGVLDSLTKGGTGDRLCGACPIHGGTNKTHFRVSVSKNCWNCFGKCQAGGTVIDFVARKEEIEFRDAALLIEEWFPGASNERAEPAEKPRFDTSKLAVAESPRSCATPHEDKPAPEENDSEPNKPLAFALNKLDAGHPYFAERGLTAETIAAFGVGFCNKGLLRGYAAIPVHNSDGDLVAYAGRWPGTPENGKGKYKLPEGFRKSLELFNLHRAMTEPEEAPLVIVEGFFDCMRLWQMGLRRVVALMGCSLSEAQEELLTRATTQHTRVIVMLDEDEAGRAGRMKILERLALKMFVRVFRFGEEGQQPETLTAEQAEELRAP